MSEHTPGPWHVEPARTTGFAITSPCELIAASQDEYGHYGAIHNKANAILMAAAPDLLEALIALRKSFALAVGITSPFARCALELGDAAIAKAKGIEQ